MEPETKRQFRKKELLHKEIVQSLEVVRLTETKYRPSTVRTITKFKNSIPKVKAILKSRKLQKIRETPYTWWDVLTVIYFISLLGTFAYLVGRYISKLF